MEAPPAFDISIEIRPHDAPRGSRHGERGATATYLEDKGQEVATSTRHNIFPEDVHVTVGVEKGRIQEVQQDAVHEACTLYSSLSYLHRPPRLVDRLPEVWATVHNGPQATSTGDWSTDCQGLGDCLHRLLGRLVDRL